jgi:peptide/nickel transport system substrate-binding protein
MHPSRTDGMMGETWRGIMHSDTSGTWPRWRRIGRRRLLATAGSSGAALAALTLAACGGDSDSTSGTSTTPAAGGTAAAAASGKEGGNLVVAAFADVNGLDPHTTTADDLGLRTTSMFEGLVEQDDKLKFVPALAESWSNSPDGVEWTFKLRRGVSFQDGTPFNAAAVKENFDRVLNPQNALSTRNALVFLKEVQVVDDQTVKFVHSQPDAAALANVGSLSLVSPTAFKAKSAQDFARSPVGTGPFKFKEWVPDDRVTLERFDGYWGGRAKLDTITFRVIRDENARLTAVRTGEVDFIPRISYPLLPVVERDRSVQVVETIPFFRTYFGIGNRPKFADARVRQAVVRYGCPRERILKDVFFGHGEVAVGPVPSPSEWYIDYKSQVPYDPNKARSLLAEAGARDLSFDVIYPGGDPVLVDALTVWQSALKEIGATMNLSAVDNTAFLRTITAPAGDYDMCFAPSQGPIGDFQVVRVTHRSTGSSNISHNNNPQIDMLIDQAQATLEFEKRKALYDQMFKLAIEDSKQYYVTFYPVFRVLSQRVKGYTKDNATWYRFKDVTVLS